MNQFSELICCFFICSPATYDILRISLIYLNCDEQEAGKVPRGSNQKFKLYRLAQIMMEQTDDEHYITMPEIIEELAKYDVTADRKSVYADLRDLSILGIEVEGEPIGNRYHYHVVSRAFELPELKLLVDAIQSSKFITEKKTNRLIKKLETLVSKYDAQKLQRQVFVSG